MNESEQKIVEEKPPLEIVYQDEYLIAINKPHGLLVHQSRIAADATEFAVQTLRDQVGRFVHPLHRLDRKTSGILLFGLDPETAKLMSEQFTNHTMRKEYWAICRGYFPDDVYVNYALTNDSGKTQEAQTNFRRLKQNEIPLPFGQHQTSRYALVEAIPKTGRMHQIRKHLAHLQHPIIGDRPHGCNKQNKLFKEKWGMMSMMLHARELTLDHPYSKERFTIKAKHSEEFERMLQTLGLKEMETPSMAGGM